MPLYGLKLGIGEEALSQTAAELWRRGKFDFLELYVPLSAEIGEAALWAWYDGALILHAPHSVGGFNFASEALRDSNRVMLKKMAQLVRVMRPLGVVFHPGYGGSEAECLRQIASIRREWPELHRAMLLENKPQVSLDGVNCLGASPVEMKRLLEETDCRFCFDVRHAIAYSASVGLPWLKVVREFALFMPALWHVADGNAGEELDSHLHFGEGDIEWSALGSLLRPDSKVTIECKKEPAAKLEDFLADAAWLKIAWEKTGNEQ